MMLFFEKRKKLDPQSKTALGIMLKKNTFSRRSRKPPNLCPTHTQWHRSSRETGLALDPCFDVGQTRGFFQRTDKLRILRPTNPPLRGFEL
jgi:hypothetical protein